MEILFDDECVVRNLGSSMVPLYDRTAEKVNEFQSILWLLKKGQVKSATCFTKKDGVSSGSIFSGGNA
jgi:hypothetical protein